MDYYLNMLGPLSQGAVLTLEIFFVTLILSLPLGLLLALIRVSRYQTCSKLVSGYIWLMRGTPLMLQMFFVYFALPAIGIKFPGFISALLAFALNYAAYFAEIFRGGIQSINRGQYEASKVLGLSYRQTMRRIVLPQVIKRILAPVSNETITLVKDTSLVYVLSMNDLMRVTYSFIHRDFSTTPFIVAGAFYLIMTLILTIGFRHLEQKYAVYDE